MKNKKDVKKCVSPSQLHKALTEQQNFHGAIENAFDAIALWDYGRDNLLRYVNPAWEKLFGYKAEEVIDSLTPPIFAAIKKTPSLNKELKACLKRKEGFFGEVEIIHKTGTKVPVAFSIAPIYNDHPEPVLWVTILHDISIRKKAEARVQEVNSLKNKFIQIVSHQLRTPLGAISWNLETLLAGEIGKISEAQKKFLRMTHNANREVLRRLRDLLTALDIEQGKAHLNREYVSLESICSTVLAERSKKLQIKDLTISYKKPKTNTPPLLADINKIQDAIEKLLDNAINYTSKGGQIQVEISHNKKKVHLTITDNGIGIRKADQKNIFQAFFRGVNASSMFTDASGLGLYIAQHHATEHGGKIRFKSTKKGSSFILELPIT